MEDSTLLLLLMPLVLIELSLRAWCLFKLVKADPATLRGPRGVWIAVVLLINFGWAAFLLAGRKDA